MGRITVDIYHILEKNGDSPLIAYGRRGAPDGLNTWKFGGKPDMAKHVLATFFKGEHGFSSAGQTRKLIRKIEDWDPDVIHLHNIHGFVLQTDISKRRGNPWSGHFMTAGPTPVIVRFMTTPAVKDGKADAETAGNTAEHILMRCFATGRPGILKGKRLRLPGCHV